MKQRATKAVPLIELCYAVLRCVHHRNMVTEVVWTIDLWLSTSCLDILHQFNSSSIQYMKFFASHLVGIVSFIEFTELLRTLFVANSIEKLENFDEIEYVLVYASRLSTLLSFTIYTFLSLKHIQFYFQTFCHIRKVSLLIFQFLVVSPIRRRNCHFRYSYPSESERHCRIYHTKCTRHIKMANLNHFSVIHE